MTLRHRPAMMLIGGIEMRSGSRGIRRRAIAELVNMKAVFARGQTGDVGNDLDFVSDFSERYCSSYFASGFRLELGGSLGDSLCLRRPRQRAKYCGEDNRFHPANVGRSGRMKTLH